MIFLPAFNLDQMLALLPRATCLMGVPTFYTRLLDDPRFPADLTRHMRLFVSGSAPLLANTHKQFETRTVGLPPPGVDLRATDAVCWKTR